MPTIGLTTVNNSPYEHVLKIKIPKKIVKYTQDSMLFVVGLQVNEHVFFKFNPWKSQGGFFSSNSVKRPVNVYRPHDFFFHSFWRHSLICAEANIVPLNLKRNDFDVSCGYAVCNGIHTHGRQLKSFDKTAIVYSVGILFWIYCCNAVRDSPIYVQVWAL